MLCPACEAELLLRFTCHTFTGAEYFPAADRRPANDDPDRYTLYCLRLRLRLHQDHRRGAGQSHVRPLRLLDRLASPQRGVTRTGRGSATG